jgi:hypothetical protein
MTDQPQWYKKNVQEEPFSSYTPYEVDTKAGYSSIRSSKEMKDMDEDEARIAISDWLTGSTVSASSSPSNMIHTEITQHVSQKNK